jgi:hypothetical protein
MLGHVMPNLCFSNRWICRTRSAFRCVQGVKHDGTIFNVRVGSVRIRQKMLWARYAEHVFLHQVGCAGRVVNSGASGALIVDAIFFMLGRAWGRFH